MRRSDREIKDFSALEEIIRGGLVCHLGLLRGSDPYIVPMSYGYEKGFLYFHSAKDGMKVDCMRTCSRVCFEIDTDVSVTAAGEACDWTMSYRSVIGYGNISEVTGDEEKTAALNVIMEHYSGRKGWAIPRNQLDRTLVLRLEIAQVTGKRSAG